PNPRFENYLAVHDKWMTRFLDDGFVVEDRCEFTFLPPTILLQGAIICLNGLTLEVEKEIAILGGTRMDARVQTRRFRYHAWVRGMHNILRYESAHDHRPHAHKHEYNTFGDGRESRVLDLLDEDEIPTLGEVVAELQLWYQENASQLRRLS
ncbi:MAG: hypothetical protein ACREN6_03175, partial [Gemmatimonadaceae bacterium]